LNYSNILPLESSSLLKERSKDGNSSTTSKSMRSREFRSPLLQWDLFDSRNPSLTTGGMEFVRRRNSVHEHLHLLHSEHPRKLSSCHSRKIASISTSSLRAANLPK
ncbi:hypothetical protein PFISCL1PPCAC_11046, partial [Pristionchus fissidentatus]